MYLVPLSAVTYLHRLLLGTQTVVPEAHPSSGHVLPPETDMHGLQMLLWVSDHQDYQNKKTNAITIATFYFVSCDRSRLPPRFAAVWCEIKLS